MNFFISLAYKKAQGVTRYDDFVRMVVEECRDDVNERKL
jgi:hypothetical protein